jgi:hypothetical protein
LGDVRRELMQRLSAYVHGTLGSYLRDALHEGSAEVMALPPCSSGFGLGGTRYIVPPHRLLCLLRQLR